MREYTYARSPAAKSACNSPQSLASQGELKRKTPEPFRMNVLLPIKWRLHIYGVWCFLSCTLLQAGPDPDPISRGLQLRHAQNKHKVTW